MGFSLCFPLDRWGRSLSVWQARLIDSGRLVYLLSVSLSRPVILLEYYYVRLDSVPLGRRRVSLG